MAWSIQQVTHIMEKEIPFNRVLGMETVIEKSSAEEGVFAIRIPFRAELIGDAGRPALHGGVISALIDTAGGGAAFLVVDEGQRVSTVDMTVDYLQPGPAAPILATARVVRKGNRVVLANIEVRAEEKDELIALGRAVYNIHDPR